MADDGQHPVDMCELKEQTKHGDEGFPVGWYPRLSKVWQGYFFVPHWHRELELIFVESGKNGASSSRTVLFVTRRVCCFVAT